MRWIVGHPTPSRWAAEVRMRNNIASHQQRLEESRREWYRKRATADGRLVAAVLTEKHWGEHRPVDLEWVYATVRVAAHFARLAMREEDLR